MMDLYQTTPWKAWYDAEDPVLSLAFRDMDLYSGSRSKWLNTMKKYGSMATTAGYFEKEEFDATQEPSKDMSGWQLEKIADELLRTDSRHEVCRSCGRSGSETGEFEFQPMIDSKTKEYVTDDDGNVIYADVPEIICEKGHRWYLGEGKRRGIDGRNPILFENHLRDRRRREIQTGNGTPDPSIARGIYNRCHPQGRKVNSKEQRRRNGASFFRIVDPFTTMFLISILVEVLRTFFG